MAEKKSTPDQIADTDLDQAQGGILTTNENLTQADLETARKKLRGTAPAWNDATGHFD